MQDARGAWREHHALLENDPPFQQSIGLPHKPLVPLTEQAAISRKRANSASSTELTSAAKLPKSVALPDCTPLDEPVIDHLALSGELGSYWTGHDPRWLDWLQREYCTDEGDEVCGCDSGPDAQDVDALLVDCNGEAWHVCHGWLGGSQLQPALHK
eukprot:169491-Rhodomonas_salina.4